MRIGRRPGVHGVNGDTTDDDSNTNTPSPDTPRTNTTCTNTTCTNTTRANTAACAKRLPAGFLGRQQYDPSGAERHDVQVPESDQWRLSGQPGLVERQDQWSDDNSFHCGTVDLRYAGKQLRKSLRLPGPGTDATAVNSKYYDFMEYTIGNNPPAFHGNTTRVDAFGIKLTMQMLCADGYQVTVGENAATFAEDRSVTFQRFLAQVPLEYQHLAQVQAPYRILSPDAAFNAGGQYADYYSAYIDGIWQSNGLTILKAGPNASGLGSYPDLSAAIYRHVAVPGTFKPDGTLVDPKFWSKTSSVSFYQNAPANYYAQFWHQNAINGLAYGFPYDDVGGYSTYISHNNPLNIQIAIGW
jgi:hypothetical protein